MQHRNPAKKWLRTQPAFRNCLPLALGVGKAVLGTQPETISNVKLRRALHWHITSTEYRLAVAQGGPRHNADGTVNGVVTDAEAFHALEVLTAPDALKAVAS